MGDVAKAKEINLPKDGFSKEKWVTFDDNDLGKYGMLTKYREDDIKFYYKWF